MTPYQYRRIKRKLEKLSLCVSMIWHYTKQGVHDILYSVALAMCFIVCPCLYYAILSFFV